jgi:hypothetical protein
LKYLIDTNMLLLLVVGLTNKNFIQKHKALSVYNQSHFEVLIEKISSASSIITTPNILTETSNLLCQTGDPVKTLLLIKFGIIIKEFKEIYIPSQEVVDVDVFKRLGLTDTVITALKNEQCTVLTTDGPLCYVCSMLGIRAENLTPIFFD